jgi:hypothetical protein
MPVGFLQIAGLLITDYWSFFGEKRGIGKRELVGWGVNEKDFYQRLLGVEAPWKVTGVELDLEHQRVEVEVSCEAVEWVDEAGKRAHIHGYEERRWRHLTPASVRPGLKPGYQGCVTKMVRHRW